MTRRSDHNGIHTYVSPSKLKRDYAESHNIELPELVIDIAKKVARFEHSEMLVKHPVVRENPVKRKSITLIIPQELTEEPRTAESALKFVFSSVSYKIKEEIYRCGSVLKWAERQPGYSDALTAERLRLEAMI